MFEELITIKGECHHRRKEARYTLAPGPRAAMDADNIDWAKRHRAETALLERAQIEEYKHARAIWFGDQVTENTEPREMADQTREAKRYRIGQGAFFVAEACIGGALAAATLTGGLILSGLIGLVLALFMAGAAVPLVSRWVRHEADVQPAKQMHRLTRGLLYLGGAWLLAAAVALTVLRSPENTIGALVFWVSMALLTLLSPLCSALCGVAADMLCWSWRICRNLSKIRSVSRELELLGTASARGASRPSVDGGPPAAAAALMLVALCAAPGHAADVPGRVANLEVRLYPDVSASIRLADTQQILKDFGRGLSTYDGAGPLHVSITPFYENAFMATTFVEATIAGNRARDCPLPVTEIARLARGYADARKRECDQFLAQAHKQAEIVRASEISKLSAAVDRLSGLKLPGRCTAVNVMIRRAATEMPTGVSVVITDAENTCLSRDPPANFRPVNNVYIIPVSSRHRPIEGTIDDIEAHFRRSMPWVQVVESYRLQVVVDALNRNSRPQRRDSDRGQLRCKKDRLDVVMNSVSC